MIKNTKVVEKKSLRIDNNSFEFVLTKTVEKRSIETDTNTFDFVLNKVVEIQSVNTENNFFDFVLYRNLTLKEKINNNNNKLYVNTDAASSFTKFIDLQRKTNFRYNATNTWNGITDGILKCCPNNLKNKRTKFVSEKSLCEFMSDADKP